MAVSGFQAGLALLRRRDVSRLFIAYLVTYTGTAMAPIAIAFGVLDLTGSTRDSAIVIAAPTIAAIGILLIGGVLADRTSRQRIMVFSDLLAMIAQLSIAFLLLSGEATVPMLTLLMLINGTAMALNFPASTGLIIQIVDRDELQTVNALLGTARNSAVAGGAALGGVFVATLGAGMTLVIDAISFGASAILVLSLRPRLQISLEKASFIADLAHGWKEFVRHTWLWVIVAQFSLLVAVHESLFGLIGPAVALERMGGATDWGFIAASFGVGLLLGGVLSLRIDVKHPMRFATLLTFSFAALPLALAVPLSMPLVAAAALINGMTGEIFSVLWNTTLQQKIPPQMLSRVSAYDHLGSLGLAPLGIVAAGFVFELLGHRTTLLTAAAFVIIPSLAAFAVRDVRMLTRSGVDELRADR